jgi:glyoxylase-like metal-dependent hydrolase (beta-lactamase superfamily II)
MVRIEKHVGEGVYRVEDAYVNWYLVEEGPAVTVVDTGLPRSWSSLREALGEIGRRPADVAGVALTHAHSAQTGFARRARRELGVPLYAAAADLGVVSHPWRYGHERSRIPYLARYPGFRRAFAAMTLAGALWVRGARDVELLEPGVPLDLPGRPLPITTPGHTDGHVSFHLPDRGVLIAGDALVTLDPYTGGVGPQIVSGAATADSPRALDSLEALAATGAALVLPGHGNPWRDGAAAAVARAREAGPS